jgi:hypothetical protein
VRPATNGAKAVEGYVPSLSVRRRSIPSIACSLYHAVEACVLTMQTLSHSAPAYYAVNKAFYEIEKSKVERYIRLLVFCGLDEDRVRWWVRGAWKQAKEGPRRLWSDTREQPGAGRRLLELLGYQLADGEPDGYGDNALASLGNFLVAEGATGR